MARLRRSSAVLETARQRLSGLKSITPKPNFGPALDIDQYEQDINALNDSLDKYNQTVALLDQMQNALEDDETKLNDKSKRMLAATGAQYGPDSSEYEIVGGTRTSDRKRPASKKPDDSKPGDNKPGGS
jgi:exonuclease VII small subunit